MKGGAVGQVVQSKAAGLWPRDFVTGFWGWQEFATVDAKSLRKLDPEVEPVSTALGVLGMPGMTAYFGLLDVGGEVGEVHAAAGAAQAFGIVDDERARVHPLQQMGRRDIGEVERRVLPHQDYVENGERRAPGLSHGEMAAGDIAPGKPKDSELTQRCATFIFSPARASRATARQAPLLAIQTNATCPKGEGGLTTLATDSGP